jgi:transposase
LHELMMTTVLASPKIFADDTTLPVLDPGRGKTKTGRLWCYAVDNRPWRGPGHPVAVYIYSDDRKGVHPAEHLKGYGGLLQVDGYAGFAGLVTDPAGDAPQLAFCWAHARRKFYDVFIATKAPIAEETLAGRGSLRDRKRASWQVRGRTSARARSTKSAARRGHA